MHDKFIQLIPVGVTPNAFYALDATGWVWYGAVEGRQPDSGPKKIKWHRIEWERIVPKKK